MTPREAAELEAKETYIKFLDFCKKGTWVIFAVLLIVASCNFGVEEGPNATGGKYDPSLAEEYNERMKEMGEQFKNKH